MAQFMNAMWSGSYRSIAPKNVFRSLAFINPIFRGFAQQDAQEALRTIIGYLSDKLQDEIPESVERAMKAQKAKKIKDAEELKNHKNEQTPEETAVDASSEVSTNSSTNDTEQEAKETRRRITYDSVLENVFGGVLRSRIFCLQCKEISDCAQTFFEVSLSLPNRKLREKISKRLEEMGKEAIQVKEGFFASFSNLVGFSTRKFKLIDLLHGFCCPDELVGRDKYLCEKCKKYSEARKEFAIAKVPQVLTVHVKRFKYDSYFGSKLSDHISFPLNNLNLAPFCTRELVKDSSLSTLYNCVGVINHRGSLNGGHYVAYCRNRVSNKWYEYDDSHVREVSAREVENVEAYVLVYVRKDSATKLDERARVMATIKQYRQDYLDEQITNNDHAVYVSKLWFHKWRTLVDPGPITNADILCKHGNIEKSIFESLQDRIVELPRSVGDEFIDNYGGVVLDPSKGACSVCVDKVALAKRRSKECNRIRTLDRLTLRPGEFWYLIHQEWLCAWREFICTEKTDIPPGPISNDSLLMDDGITPKENLKRRAHYRGVVEEVWLFFHDTYGGGPAIVRESINIYAKPFMPPEAGILTKDGSTGDDVSDDDTDMTGPEENEGEKPENLSSEAEA
eukprot:CAMPEP_0168527916 /NCGR_PEP_ID=MMETSP0405-20121227/12916_1 /TAXON_ID=498012 /ORGANISM="Trichosphaerium sp, Strain Am-I-7 wt" /LENGTH=621 /DNA_ID=CAMNT_0008551177 /DNA_START=432 /DNA_END=2297 /DNA_ORIENTATION=-